MCMGVGVCARVLKTTPKHESQRSQKSQSKPGEKKLEKVRESQRRESKAKIKYKWNKSNEIDKAKRLNLRKP